MNHTKDSVFMKSANFQYKHEEYPHVSKEAIEFANTRPVEYTPDGAQRMIDTERGVSKSITAQREKDNPPPESEKNRPKRTNNHKPVIKSNTEIKADMTDRLGKHTQKVITEQIIEEKRAGTLAPDESINNDGTTKEKEKDFYSNWELFEAGLLHFQNDMPGLRVVFTGEGRHGGFEFGLESEYPKIRGVNVPPGTSIFKTLTKFGKGIFSTFSTIPNDKARDFWLGAISGQGYHSQISKQAPSLEGIPQDKSISIDGATAFKMIPPLDWFDEKIRKIDPIKDLLAIFPEAEANTLLLHFGRMAFGKHTGLHHRKHIENFPIAPDCKYRVSVVMNGVPRVGKSTLMEEILAAIEQVGYTFTIMSSDPNRFSWNGVRTDIMYGDDTTGDTLKTILSSSTLKSVVSGGAVQTEKKGVDGIDAFPECVTLFSANNVIIPKNVDPGVLDRTHFLTTYTHNQLIAKSDAVGINLFTGDFWENTARELKVDKTALALYLVSCGLKAFTEQLGITQCEDGTWEQDITKITVNASFNENRKNYRFKTPVDAKTSVAKICRRSHILASVFSGEEIPACYDESFSGFSLLHSAKTILRVSAILEDLDKRIAKSKSDIASPLKKKFFNEIREWLMPSNEIVITEMVWLQYVSVWKTSVGQSEANGTTFTVGNEKKTQFEDIWKTMVKVMTDKDGNLVDQERPNWAYDFENAKQDTDFYKRELAKILDRYQDDIDFSNDLHCHHISETFMVFKGDLPAMK